MILTLSLVLTGLCLLVVAWAVLKIVRRSPLLLGRPADRVLLGVLALVELGLLAQAVIGFVRAAGVELSHPITFGAYLVGVTLIIPAGTFWALVDRSRAGSGVLIVAAVTVPAMMLRMHQIWAGGA